VRTPAFAAAMLAVLLPVLLMLARAIAEITLADGNGVRAPARCTPPTSTTPASGWSGSTSG